jgi:hypothetical protein
MERSRFGARVEHSRLVLEIRCGRTDHDDALVQLRIAERRQLLTNSHALVIATSLAR